MVFDSSNDSKEQQAHQRENKQKKNQRSQQDTMPGVNKKLDGPNRPST